MIVLLRNLFILVFIVLVLLSAIRVLLFGAGSINYVAKKWWRKFEDCFHQHQVFKVPEFNESMQENQLYRKVSAYLNSLASLEDSDFTNLVTGKKSKDIILRLDPNQLVRDNFLGAKVSWTNVGKSHTHNCTTFLLRIRKADKRRILRPYLQHIHTVSDDYDQRNRDLKLYMNVENNHDYNNGRWKFVPFTHPSNFDTITMESDLKTKVKADLDAFLKAKQYYHRLGRVWKRSFLLYGQPGTGKSSFVAAMANYLSYNVYDIDLSKVSDDSDLRMLLLQTTSKSVIVVEDLDRFLTEKSKAVSLSAILNFTDGILNSCCAAERVLVFTMNSKEFVDPAMLRPGRIDVHIHFPLCDFSAFKTLANNYLGIKDHKLFPQVEEIFQTGSSLSPAEIGELMIVNRNSPSRALKSVITALQSDGGGRGSGNIGRRLCGPRKPVEEPGEPAGVYCNDNFHALREFRKLYGFLRMKSGRKSESFDLSSEQKEG